MNSQKSELVFVAGPTASGKTAYAVELAKRNNAVVINTDSRQVYKFMDIGTNKGVLKKTRESLELAGKSIDSYEIADSGVTGYLFDIVLPDEDFNLSHFLEYSKVLIKHFEKRNIPVIFVGGTGLYIDALIKNYQLQDVKPNSALREWLEGLNVEELYEQLARLDNTRAEMLNQSDRANKRRLIRAIEVASSAAVKTTKSAESLNYIMYYPRYDREKLFDRIENRVEEMFQEGLVEEVERLIKLGYKHARPMQGMGYKEIVEFLDGNITFDEAKQKIKQAHRRYALRQITWFEGKGRGYKFVPPR